MKKESINKKLAALIQSEGLYTVLDAIVTIAYDQSDLLPKNDKMGDWWHDVAETVHEVNQILRKKKPYIRY